MVFIHLTWTTIQNKFLCKRKMLFLLTPITKQMTSPDVYDPSPYFTQSYNRYSYVINNPMRYTDPSGCDWIGSGLYQRAIKQKTK